MIKAIGGDMVGMSTVPEVIVAKHMGMDVLRSLLLQIWAGRILPLPFHEEVLNAANKAMPQVITLVKGLVKNYQ